MLKRKARIGKSKIKKLAACFAEDLTATQTANLVEVNRNTVNSWYRRFREKYFNIRETTPLSSRERLSWTNRISAVREKRDTLKTEEKEEEERKTKCRFSAF